MSPVYTHVNVKMCVTVGLWKIMRNSLWLTDGMYISECVCGGGGGGTRQLCECVFVCSGDSYAPESQMDLQLSTPNENIGLHCFQ